MRHASRLQVAEDAARHVSHVSGGPFLHELGQTVSEFFVVVLREVAQRVDKDELRQDLRERVVFLHLGGEGVDLTVVVVEIRLISLLVILLLNKVHAPQVVEIIGVAHSLSVG